MNIVRSAGVPLIVLVLTALGCAEPGEDNRAQGDEPDLRPAVVKPGAGGTNGLDDVLYHAHLSQVVAAAAGPILQDGQISAGLLSTGLLGSTDGITVFGYAVKCALADGQTLTYGTHTFAGAGYLSTTTGWLSAPLSTGARDDLLGCLVAHVNSTTGVPILLSGPSVSDDGDGHDDFDVEEALWLVQQDSSGAIVHHVWPLSDFEATCLSNPWDALEQRICGQDPEGCNFVARKDMEAACVEDEESNGYICDGLPALKTTLKSADVLTLHPLCAPPRR